MTALDLARAVRIESVVRAREGKLKSQGKKWLIGPCLRSGGDDRFAINVTKQLWNCRHCDRGGDVIDLVAHLDDCTVGQAIATLAGTETCSSPWPSKTAPIPAAAVDDGEAVRRALRIWGEAVPLNAPSAALAASYLTRPRAQGGRGLTIPGELLSGHVLRFHPRHWWRGADGDPIQVPALLALYRDVRTDEPRAIWRRRLTLDGRSAGVPRYMGPKAGCAIKFTDHADVEKGLHVGEGPETVLAAMMRGFSPAWSLGDAGGVEAFPVLAGIEALTILVDNDENSAGQKASAECFDRWTAAEREVWCVVPDEVGADMNDIEAGA
jgi:Toprim domain/CHC2 zinc finger